MMRRAILLTVAALLCVCAAKADERVPIRTSKPLAAAGPALGTGGYQPLEDEKLFADKVTEKAINLWDHIVMPKPENLSQEEWEKIMQREAEANKKMIPVKDYELRKQAGEYVGWFGIVRSVAYDEKANQTRLRAEHKYFDGLTDLHIHIVSIYGAGDFEVILPGRVEATQVPRLGLVRVYGKVAAGDPLPGIKAEYVRVWDWGLFTFMDYGQDKSNSDWVKLRKVSGDGVYSPRPNNRFYIDRLGPREEDK